MAVFWAVVAFIWAFVVGVLSVGVPGWGVHPDPQLVDMVYGPAFWLSAAAWTALGVCGYYVMARWGPDKFITVYLVAAFVAVVSAFADPHVGAGFFPGLGLGFAAEGSLYHIRGQVDDVRGMRVKVRVVQSESGNHGFEEIVGTVSGAVLDTNGAVYWVVDAEAVLPVGDEKGRRIRVGSRFLVAPKTTGVALARARKTPGRTIAVSVGEAVDQPSFDSKIIVPSEARLFAVAQLSFISGGAQSGSSPLP